MEASVLVSARIKASPARGWFAVGVGHVLVDAPDDLQGDMLIAGKQFEWLLLLTPREQA